MKRRLPTFEQKAMDDFNKYLDTLNQAEKEYLNSLMSNEGYNFEDAKRIVEKWRIHGNKHLLQKLERKRKRYDRKRKA